MSNQKDITFQILDWSSSHRDTLEGAQKYIVRLFGMTEDKKTICVEATDFTPYFYIEVPDNWGERDKHALMDVLRSTTGKKFKDRTAKGELIKRYKFWEFSAGKLFKFIRLTFDDEETRRTYMYALSERVISIPLIGIRKKFRVYEANIDPLIRFMHTQDLNACGWCTLKSSTYKVVDIEDVDTSCKINVITKFHDIHPCTGRDSDIQPFTIAAFDIECISADGSFPIATRESDKIISIATTFSRYGEKTCYYRHSVILGTCNPIEGADVVQCKTEQELLMEWTKMMRKQDPDFITGWNIFGFDEMYIKERCVLLNILPFVSRLSRIVNEASPFVEKKLSSSALGDNLLYYFETKGRVHYDLMKVVQKDYKLVSYKLDYVSAYFFREVATDFKLLGENTEILTNSTFGVKKGQYTMIVYNDGVTDYEHMNGRKFKIIDVKPNSVIVEGIIDLETLNKKHKIYWCQVKDDVKPKEIFEKFRGSDADRTELIEYNIQDCELCNKLTWKLDVLTNNIGMANVCNVPLTYLFLRGQGVKIFSLVSKKCRKENYLIPVIKKINKESMTPEQLEKYKKEKTIGQKFELNTERKHVDSQAFDPDEDDVGFEGALVIPPIAGVYLSPIIVLDYASLYPSAMIYRNLSHECLVKDEKYMNLPDYKYITITYNNPDGKQAPPCVFARKLVRVENADKIVSIKEEYGILPQILQELLKARKDARVMQEKETDPFKKKVLDGLQLAYKITANSLYGQTGAPTSPIYMKEIAACTTATGREMLHFSQEFVETIYDKIVNYAVDDRDKFMKFMEEKYGKKGATRFVKAFKDSTTKEDFFEKVYKEIIELIKGYHVSPKIIYGDTDSVFYDLRMRDDVTRKLLQDKVALEKSIRMGQLASALICTLLDPPMRQEYEKCLWPFMILSKKRYVGNLYMDNPNKYFQKCMGIVLKRRDNANIVKIVCGGIIDHILNKRDPAGAIEFTKKTLSDIMKCKFGLDKFVITKTLRSDYKNRESISHAVLADRMKARDPGNAPVSNDRIPYVFVVPNGPVNLQGDRIEHVDYVVQNKLKIDYLYYITNQIMKPALQFLELVAKNPKVMFDKVIMIEQNCRIGVKPVMTYYE